MAQWKSGEQEWKRSRACGDLSSHHSIGKYFNSFNLAALNHANHCVCVCESFWGECSLKARKKLGAKSNAAARTLVISCTSCRVRVHWWRLMAKHDIRDVEDCVALIRQFTPNYKIATAPIRAVLNYFSVNKHYGHGGSACSHSDFNFCPFN